MSRPTSPRRRGPASPAPGAAVAPLSAGELETLQELLDAVPAPLEPLDVCALDGFLCGVLVQPARIPPARWLPHVTDTDGRTLPRGYDAGPLHGLVQRRHVEIEAAIGRRRWLDPWVFEADDEGDGADPIRAAVLPWVAGVATAFELFPGIMQLPPEATLAPLALLYQHVDADDLEDADELLAEIESIEPPADLTEAVEQLVRAIFLLADAAAGKAR
ncbi:MAG: YecA family protein [Caldimonas sp.]